MRRSEGLSFGRALLSAMAVLMGVIVLVGLILRYAQGDMSKEFFIFYMALGLFSIFMGVIAFVVDFAVKRLRSDSLLAKAFFIFEQSTLRPGSLFLPIPFILAGIFSLVIVVLVASTSASVFPVANPYSASLTLDTASLEGKGVVAPLFDGAVVPGVFEEMAIFFAIQATIGFVLFGIWLLLGRRDDLVQHPFIYWFVAIGSIAVWSIGFSLAHGRYGGNSEAFVFAFVFEFVVQTVNQVTGSFVSWIPHVVHNSMVLWNRSFSFVTFLVIPVAPLLWRRWCK